MRSTASTSVEIAEPPKGFKPSPLRWALLWRSHNRLDGHRANIINEDCLPVLFRTRREARAYAERKFGYIKTSKDLRQEPHGWKFPRPVRVRVVLEVME